MRTGIFEHFGNLNVKGDDFYWHGIGLKKIPKYSATFWIHSSYGVIDFYRRDGTLLSTATLSHTNQTSILETVFNPATDRAYFVTHWPGQPATSGAMEVVEVSTGQLIASIQVGRSSRVDTDAKGMIYTVDNEFRKIKKLNKDGLLQREITTGGVITTNPMSYWGKENVVNASNLGLFNPVNLSRISTLTPGYILSDGKVMYYTGGLTVKFATIDWDTHKVISETTSIDVRPYNLQHNWTVNYLTEIKGKVYFFIRNNTAGYQEEQIVEISTNGAKRSINLTLAKNVMALDERYYYCVTSSYEVRKRSDQSLVLTVPVSGNRYAMGTTKGNYNNFKNYW